MLPKLLTEIPGPESRRLAKELRHYESRNVTFINSDFPIFWERAEGVNVWDADGNRFLDFTSAFAVAGLGHNHPAVVAALHAQSVNLIHAMGDVHPTRGKVELCRLLSEITFERWGRGIARTLLANSGSEAIEAALKTALLCTGKPGILSFHGAYHGLGHGALETTGISFFRQPFQTQLGRFGVRVTYPCQSAQLEGLRKEIDSLLRTQEIGAILVEPIQGRGGEIVPPEGFLPMLREISRKTNTLLILDEIYTGFYRTGRLFACEHTGVIPDLICLGKALTSGFPLSACVGPAEIMDAWPENHGEALHTSTYLGNPLGCAMALASIREHLAPATEKLVQKSTRLLDETLTLLKGPHIGEFRGRGLMRGIELRHSNGSPNKKLANEIVIKSLKEGLLLLAGSPSGNVLSLTPPFAVTQEEIQFALAKIQEYATFRPGSIS